MRNHRAGNKPRSQGHTICSVLGQLTQETNSEADLHQGGSPGRSLVDHSSMSVMVADEVNEMLKCSVLQPSIPSIPPIPQGDPELGWPLDLSGNLGCPWKRASSWVRQCPLAQGSSRERIAGSQHSQQPWEVPWSSPGDLWGSPQHPLQPTPCFARNHLLQTVKCPHPGKDFPELWLVSFLIKT